MSARMQAFQAPVFDSRSRRSAVAPIDPYPSRDGATPACLPRQDPVVYQPWSPDAPLSEEQFSSYRDDGFVVLEGLFSPTEIASLTGELERLRAPGAALRQPTVIREAGRARSTRSIFEVHRQSRLLRRLAVDRRLVAVAEFLLADRVYIHQSRLNYKPGFVGREFSWHSDFETWHVEDGMPRMRALSISLLLSSNNAHNGPLLLVPGSHETFIGCVGDTPADHYKSSLRRQEYGTPDHATLAALVDAGGIASVVGSPGTMVVFDCNTLHGSNGNITPSPRSNAFIVYNSVRNRLQPPFGGSEPRPEFIASRGSAEPLTARPGPIR